MDPKQAIDRLIDDLGWTEVEIATSVGCSQPTVNRIKNGTVPNYPLGTALVNLASSAKPRQPKAA
jgi:predicted transcriptional regulator